jgi:hypothetical protein
MILIREGRVFTIREQLPILYRTRVLRLETGILNDDYLQPITKNDSINI